MNIDEIRDFIRNSPAPIAGFRWVLDLTRDDNAFAWVAVRASQINTRQITPLREITTNEMNQGQFVTERARTALRRLERRRRRDPDEDVGKENKAPRTNDDGNDGNDGNGSTTDLPSLEGLGRMRESDDDDDDEFFGREVIILTYDPLVRFRIDIDPNNPPEFSIFRQFKIGRYWRDDGDPTITFDDAVSTGNWLRANPEIPPEQIPQHELTGGSRWGNFRMCRCHMRRRFL